MKLLFFKEEIEWQQLPNGLYYHGETDLETGLPEGLGVQVLIAGIGTGFRKEYAYYIGQFHNGKREGHGYVLHYKEVEDQYWQRGTYEEVMATAEFDSCGRPIHYQNVGKWVTTTFWRWVIEQNGLWAGDVLVSQDPYNFSKIDPWVKGRFEMTVQQLAENEWKDVEYNWHNSENFHYSLSENFGYWTNKWPGYDNCVAVNKFNRERLIVCNEYAHVFTVGYGQQHIFIRPDKPSERFVYTIKDKE